LQGSRELEYHSKNEEGGGLPTERGEKGGGARKGRGGVTRKSHLAAGHLPFRLKGTLRNSWDGGRKKKGEFQEGTEEKRSYLIRKESIEAVKEK